MKHLLVTNDFPPKVGGIQAYLWNLWRHSPEHDANMRARDVTQIGVALAPGRNGCYASMELGSPL